MRARLCPEGSIQVISGAWDGREGSPEGLLGRVGCVPQLWAVSPSSVLCPPAVCCAGASLLFPRSVLVHPALGFCCRACALLKFLNNSLAWLLLSHICWLSVGPLEMCQKCHVDTSVCLWTWRVCISLQKRIIQVTCPSLPKQ